MNDGLRHRGPDGEGFHLGPGVGLAMRRLAIIDVAGGQQPIGNEDGSAWIVFNGEIYNYRDLRQRLQALGHRFATASDTEVVLHAWEQYGEDCPRHLRGMFAFAIWNSIDEELFLARDRVGKKPLLYSVVDGDLLFASEFRALLTHRLVSREIDFPAIDHYLTFSCIPAPLTAFRSIRKLEPGHTLRWRQGEVSIRRYWLPDFTRKIDIGEEEAAERTLELLREAVRIRLMSEVPLGAFLSGGIDSSLVVSLMAESSARVKTFSIGFEERDFSELEHARRVAQHFGTDHHEFIVKPDATDVLPLLVDHYGEPYADSSAIPTYYLARETRRHVTVALNGDGGDECFAGYERYLALKLSALLPEPPRSLSRRLARATAALPIRSRRTSVGRAARFAAGALLPWPARYLSWISAFDDDDKRTLYTAGFEKQTQASSPQSLVSRWLDGRRSSGVIDRVLLTDTLTYLPNDLLVKVDIATMAVSLEARSPFLDHEIIEFAASLPERMKLRRLTTKYLLRRIAAGRLPAENVHRRKMGFGVPVGDWLRGSLRSLLNDLTLSERALSRGFFVPSTVARLVEEHCEGRRDHTDRLWALMMLELWLRRFIDVPSLDPPSCHGVGHLAGALRVSP